MYYYHPKRSCGKVIFSVACVKNSVHRGGGGRVPGQEPPLIRYTHPWAGIHTHTAGQVHPLRQVHTHPWAGTPPAGTPPAGTPQQVHTPWAGIPPGQVYPRAGTLWAGTHPGAVHAGRYGQQAGCTHATGMHSCRSISAIYEFIKEWYILIPNCSALIINLYD